MELNREQIVKALEHWIKNFDGKLIDFKTLCEALALIKELTEENERLRADYEKNDSEWRELYADSQSKWEKAYEKLEEENKRLQSHVNR